MTLKTSLPDWRHVIDPAGVAPVPRLGQGQVTQSGHETYRPWVSSAGDGWPKEGKGKDGRVNFDFVCFFFLSFYISIFFLFHVFTLHVVWVLILGFFVRLCLCDCLHFLMFYFILCIWGCGCMIVFCGCGYMIV